MSRIGRAARTALVAAMVAGGLVACSSDDGCGGKRFFVMSSWRGRQGDEIKVTGSGFLEGCTSGAPLTGIEMTMTYGQRHVLATVDADAQGDLAYTITIPSDAKQGEYVVRLADQRAELTVL